MEAGAHEDAAGHLKTARPIYARLGSEIDHLRYQWFEGKIFLGRESFWRAQICFSKALQGFREKNLFYEAALVQLDLCHVWFLEGRTLECQVAATEALQIFQAMKISREALAAVILLEQAVREERATVTLLRTAAQLAARGEGGR